ncbi:MAG TPA: hypothetical protein VGM92_10960 [Candidatus Kapabacteria bacterium]
MKAHNTVITMALRGVLLAGLLAGTLAAAGCDSTSPGKTGQPLASAAKVKTVGTVVFRETGGGFYGILTDKGGQFEPSNLDPKYQSDGLHITFSGALDTSHLGEHHWGNPIELANVKAEQ